MGLGVPSRGPLGTFTGKASVPDHNVDLAKITAASQVFPISPLQGNVVDLVGIEKRPVIFPLTVIQAGQRVDLARITAASQVFAIDPVQTNPNNRDVFLERIVATSQVRPFAGIDFENVVGLGLIQQVTVVNPMTVDVIGIGQISLTPADFIQIRDTILNWEVEPGTGLTFRNLLRALYAEVAGVTIGEPGAAGTFGYRQAGLGQAGVPRVQGITDGGGKRFSVDIAGQ